MDEDAASEREDDRLTSAGLSERTSFERRAMPEFLPRPIPESIRAAREAIDAAPTFALA